ELLRNGVEIADDRIPKGKCLIAAQAIEEWHKPIDQIGSCRIGSSPRLGLREAGRPLAKPRAAGATPRKDGSALTTDSDG
ncbi:MAG: hypothetical protein ACK55I_29315, partial [bacterium]